ncbi:MAG: AraC family transcriptional regulator [Polyangiaceae bacterium]|nr:AraC family transcriptional regulator [Polyangiaceae bacterium]
MIFHSWLLDRRELKKFYWKALGKLREVPFESLVMPPLLYSPLKRLGHLERPLLFKESAVELDAGIASAGFSHIRQPPYDWHGLKRKYAEFVLFQHTISGEGRLTFEGKTSPVLPGQTMLLSFPHDNRYFLPEGGNWEFFYLALRGPAVARVWAHLLARVGPLVQFPEGAPPVSTAARVCERVLRGDIASAAQASALAYSLAMEALDAVQRSDDANVPPFVRRVREYCRQNLGRPIGVPQMANAAGLSRHHFTREFQKCVRISPGRYLMQLRLDAAVELVQEGRLSVKEIAAHVGFSSANYFGKVFTRRFGVSPGAFKESGMY